ncbi:MAG: hypothetical protein NTV94_02290 [Planctomycetota bacterium]|nr:hypothetical protein [Planctomycetota bacterium]
MLHWASKSGLALVAACSVMSAPVAAQTPLELKDRGVSVTIPQGWEVAPPAMLESMNRLLKERAPGVDLQFVSGLVPSGGGGSGGDGAYVLIQFLPLKTWSMSREELAKAFSVEYLSATMKDMVAKQEDLVKDHATESSFFDATRDRYVMTANMTVPGVVGKQRNYSVGQVLSDGVLQFNCYAPLAEFAKHQGAFDWLVGSIQVAEDRRYAPLVVGGVPVPASSTKRSSSVVPIGLIVVVIAIVAAKRRKANAVKEGGAV